jgi:hypothetical protein
VSTRPYNKGLEDADVMANDVDSDADEEGIPNEMGSGPCERIAQEKDDVVVKRVLDPQLPSQKEVDMHYVMGHLPFRSWCPVCVKAKGREMDHRADSGKERKMPAYSWDYCFPGDEFGFKWTVLVGKER